MKEELIKSLDIDVGDADDVTLLKINLENGKGKNIYYPNIKLSDLMSMIDEFERTHNMPTLDEFLDIIMVLKL